jgi:hypothetical protein
MPRKPPRRERTPKPADGTTESESDRFTDLTRRLVNVPKEEIDEQRAREQEEKEQRGKA